MNSATARRTCSPALVPSGKSKRSTLVGFAALGRIDAHPEVVDEGGGKGRDRLGRRRDDPGQRDLAFQGQGLGHQVRTVVGTR